MLKLNVVATMVVLLNVSYAGADEVKIISKTLQEDSKVCGVDSEYVKKTGQECAVKKVRYETQNYSI